MSGLWIPFFIDVLTQPESARTAKHSQEYIFTATRLSSRGQYTSPWSGADRMRRVQRQQARVSSHSQCQMSVRHLTFLTLPRSDTIGSDLRRLDENDGNIGGRIIGKENFRWRLFLSIRMLRLAEGKPDEGEEDLAV
jgi:hypothetical protein